MHSRVDPILIPLWSRTSASCPATCHPPPEDGSVFHQVRQQVKKILAEGERLKELPCNSIAQTTVLTGHDSRAAVLALAESGSGLAQAIMELIREIEARGLP